MTDTRESQSANDGTGTVLQLVQVSPHDGAGRRFPLRAGVSYAGRVGANDIPLDRPKVSRRHAKLVYTDLGLTIHDLDSHNGVFINGRKVRSSSAGPGDLVYIADVCLRVEATDAPEAVDAFAVESTVARVDVLSEVLRGGRRDEPEARNLAALLAATDHSFDDSEESVQLNLLKLCGELAGAELAVLVWREPDGALSTPVVVTRDGGPPSIDVSWPVVRRAVDGCEVLFSRDVEREPLVPGDLFGGGHAGTLLVVPVVVDGEALGAIYLACTEGSDVGAREVETITLVAHLIANRNRSRGLARSDTAIVDQVPIHVVPVPFEAAGEPGPEGGVDVAGLEEALRVEAARASEAEALVERLRSELETEQGRARTLETELENGTRAAEAIASERDAALARVEALDRERDAALAHIEALDREHADVQGRLGEQESVLKDADARLANHVEELAAREQRVAELESRMGELESMLADARASAQSLETERAASLARITELETEVEHARVELDSSSDRVIVVQRELSDALEEKKRFEEERAAYSVERETAQEQLRTLEQQLDELRRTHILRTSIVDALSRALPPRQAQHFGKIALGESPRADLSVSRVAALVVSLSGGDAWAAMAGPDAARHVLDQFCDVAADEAAAHDGFIEQVFGHRHLITFPGNVDGVRAAVACARAVVGRLRAAAVETQAGIHLASALSGFFGREPSAVFLELGEAMAVARGACAYAEPGTVWVTDAIRKVLAEGDDVLIAAGPYLIREFGKRPVDLFQLEERRES